MPKILCIDDEPRLRKSIVEELEDEGYETTQASNGKEGLEAIQAHKPDLVLCDITMPEMNGHELLAELRKNHPDLAGTPFIFLSALADRNDIVVGKQLGADDYLTKPIDFELLVASVKARLGRRAELDEQKRLELDTLRTAILETMPHEFRTPLNQILGFAELLKCEALGPMGNKQYLEFSEGIHAAGMELLTMAENILSLVDVLAGNLDPSEDEFAVEDLVALCVDEVDHVATKREVEVLVDLPADLPMMRTDRHLFKRVLVNLLSNAVKFSARGGQVTVTTRVDSEGRSALLISDTGIGMADADIARMLRPFSQGDSGLNRKYQGMGIGLALCVTLTERLGGTLDVQSSVGGGTTVGIRFPQR